MTLTGDLVGTAVDTGGREDLETGALVTGTLVGAVVDPGDPVATVTGAFDTGDLVLVDVGELATTGARVGVAEPETDLADGALEGTAEAIADGLPDGN